MAGVGKKSKRKAPWGGRPRVKDPKDKRVNLRCTSAQFEQLDKAASRAGLSLGAFSRAVLLKKPGPRAVRRPPVEKELLACLLGQIGKVGSNINQLTKRAHVVGDMPRLRELNLIKRDVAQMRIATLNSLGLKP